MTSLDDRKLSLALARGENLPTSLHILGWGLLLVLIANMLNLRTAFARARTRGESWREAAKSAGSPRIALTLSLLVMGIPLTLDLPLLVCQVCVSMIVVIFLVDIYGVRVLSRLRGQREGQDKR